MDGDSRRCGDTLHGGDMVKAEGHIRSLEQNAPSSESGKDCGCAELAKLFHGRVVVAGIGNELKGDDAAGVLVARRVTPGDSVTPVECGPAPENFISKISRMRPDVVLFVDAADTGSTPGHVAVLPVTGPRARGITADKELPEDASTHSPSLALAAGQITAECGADVYLVAIQPASLKLGGPLSGPVARACDAIVTAITTAAG